MRDDYPATAPDSIAVADLDGKNGPDIAVAFPDANAIGVFCLATARRFKPDR